MRSKREEDPQKKPFSLTHTHTHGCGCLCMVYLIASSLRCSALMMLRDQFRGLEIYERTHRHGSHRHSLAGTQRWKIISNFRESIRRMVWCVCVLLVARTGAGKTVSLAPAFRSSPAEYRGRRKGRPVLLSCRDSDRQWSKIRMHSSGNGSKLREGPKTPDGR